MCSTSISIMLLLAGDSSKSPSLHTNLFASVVRLKEKRVSIYAWPPMRHRSSVRCHRPKNYPPTGVNTRTSKASVAIAEQQQTLT